MTKEEIEAAKPIVAMVCLTIVGSIALVLGIDGMLLAAIVGGVGALGGYTLKAKIA